MKSTKIFLSSLDCINVFLDGQCALLAVADLEGAGGAGSLFFNHLFFCDNFEKLQTLLIKVKLIINNAPLTYV